MVLGTSRCRRRHRLHHRLKVVESHRHLHQGHQRDQRGCVVMKSAIALLQAAGRSYLAIWTTLTPSHRLRRVLLLDKKQPQLLRELQRPQPFLGSRPRSGRREEDLNLRQPAEAEVRDEGLEGAERSQRAGDEVAPTADALTPHQTTVEVRGVVREALPGDVRGRRRRDTRIMRTGEEAAALGTEGEAAAAALAGESGSGARRYPFD
mmetsp:Transcript_151870/g.264638  ORF Transcript_151870/g.264638 Transcript_151870/m.264638 type:complete len:207 (-) Transcript_151870:104-724(-)